MAMISVRLSPNEEKILEFLANYYEEEKSTVIRHSIKDMFADIQDREKIAAFEAKEKTVQFSSAEEILADVKS